MGPPQTPAPSHHDWGAVRGRVHSWPVGGPGFQPWSQHSKPNTTLIISSTGLSGAQEAHWFVPAPHSALWFFFSWQKIHPTPPNDTHQNEPPKPHSSLRHCVSPAGMRFYNQRPRLHCPQSQFRPINHPVSDDSTAGVPDSEAI